MTDDEIQQQVSRESSPVTSAQVGINADMSDIRGLRDGIKAIKNEAKELSGELAKARDILKEMKESFGLTSVTREVNQAGAQGGRIQSPGSSTGAMRGAAGTPIVGTSASAPQPIARPPMPASDGIGGGGGTPVNRYVGGTGAMGFAGGVGNALSPNTPTSMMGGIASALSSVAGQIVSAIDKRAESGRAYALAADQSTLQLQQLTGLSQRGVMGQLRTPLTEYKLGANGINQLLGMQAATGINAAQQASSVEFMRTLSGFNMSAAGATNVIQNLAQADTVNRMFMMTGMSLVGPGGAQKDTKSLIQGLAQRAGLTDEGLARSAIAPGSVTRATLTQMGVTGDLQEQVIQYAQANVQYRKKGGKGMYDPTRKADQKLMGIDNTFAMEAEETERVRGARDEQFYQDQAGAYAKLERQTQTLTEAFAKLEHSMRGLIGARTGNRVAMKLGAGIFGTLGSAAAGFALSGGNPLGALGGLAMGISNIFGDPPNDDNSGSSGVRGTVPPVTIPGRRSTTTSGTVPPNTSAVPATNQGITPDFIASVMGSTSNLPPMVQGSDNFYQSSMSPMYSKLDSNFQRQLSQLSALAARDGFTLTLVDGYRTSEEQAAEFLKRYELASDQNTNDPTRQVWNGKVYVKKAGNTDPPMKPPGQSWHEAGQAVDVDTSGRTSSGLAIEEWLRQYAPMVGIKSFSDQGEPFHLQPAWTSGVSAETYNNLVSGLQNSSVFTELPGATRRVSGLTYTPYQQDLMQLGQTMTSANQKMNRLNMEFAEGNYTALPGTDAWDYEYYYARNANKRAINENTRSNLLGLSVTADDYGKYANLMNRRYSERITPEQARRRGMTTEEIVAETRAALRSISPRTGDPVTPLTINSSAPMQNAGGGATTINQGSTVTISPVIHMNATGNNGTVSEYDLKAMAKRVARYIEQEANLSKMRGN